MEKALFQEERLRLMAEYIRTNGRADVGELSEKFDVSKVTVRRDIDILVERGLAAKAHGGVLSLENKLSYETPFSAKVAVNSEAKKRIAARAAEFVRDNDIILLDAGTTCCELARRLAEEPRRNLTIVTHDVMIAYEVARAGFAELIVAGGTLERGVFTLTGSGTAGFYRRLHVNRAFIGCDAIDAEFGVSNRLSGEADIKRAMADCADESYLLFDGSKFDRKAFSLVFSPEELQGIAAAVTDCEDARCRELFERVSAGYIVC